MPYNLVSFPCLLGRDLQTRGSRATARSRRDQRPVYTRLPPDSTHKAVKAKFIRQSRPYKTVTTRLRVEVLKTLQLFYLCTEAGRDLQTRGGRTTARGRRDQRPVYPRLPPFTPPCFCSPGEEKSLNQGLGFIVEGLGSRV